jgi:hypothetical protein
LSDRLTAFRYGDGSLRTIMHLPLLAGLETAFRSLVELNNLARLIRNGIASAASAWVVRTSTIRHHLVLVPDPAFLPKYFVLNSRSTGVYKRFNPAKQ